ncbi:hypothetical protein [uncultured Psychroserpens sp.]|uniref:O-antigen polysaccharide polymerase Wzy n=1 Tax=uncultured Psychroserpens sp. TaxID=255436 RepID=UPI0026355275|nr:hypothetical protein [uncultured Psychroserpens sp.]
MYYSLLGVLLIIYVAIVFFRALGKRLPILEMMLLIAGLQWIIGPIIEYNTTYEDLKYYMYVDEIAYMSFVVPAYAFFVLFVLYISKKFVVNIQDILDFKKFSKYGVTILFIGIVAELLGFILPGALAFLVFLLAGFKYVGAIILYFSDKRTHRYIFYGAILFLVYNSLRKALFHDFILWSTFFYMFWAIRNKPSNKIKLFTIIGAFFMLTVLQAIKADYRLLLKQGFQGNVVELFLGTVNQKYESGFFEEDQSQAELNVRLNQGWIISAVMDHVPRNQEYANGSTITEAINASLVPRFLNPDKKEAGGQENFRKYTGLSLSNDTSMGLSIIGEFYANYGSLGATLLMGVWGFFLSMLWRLLINKSAVFPLLNFFLPLVFLQVVKAETELVVVLNHLLKSILVIVLFFWLTKRYLKWQIYNEFEN